MTTKMKRTFKYIYDNIGFV